MDRKIYLYGSFQDGSRPSKVSTEINFGDLTVFRTMKNHFVEAGFDVDYILPDDSVRLTSLNAGDLLVIGGGGLLHPMMLNKPDLDKCRATKAVYGIGINWEMDTPRSIIQGLLEVSMFIRDIPFVVVRDWQTRAFLRIENAEIFPDPVMANMPCSGSGTAKAVIVAPNMETGRPEEEEIYFNSQYLTKDRHMVSDLRELWKYGHIRTSAFHGMLLGLMADATVEALIHNVKQESFLMTYWDKLEIIHDGKWVTVRCKDRKWFNEEAERGLRSLIEYART